MTHERKPFFRRHGVTGLTVALFIAAFFLIRWVVRTQRAPGAVTVIEAQGMDMSAMKAPAGVQPVAAEEASYKSVSNTQTFPATAVAYSDEEVVARIPGRVLWTSYPGDLVNAGQIVVKIEADEYATQRAQASALASGSGAMANVAEDEVGRMRSARNRRLEEVSAMEAAVTRAEADRDAMSAEQTEMEQVAASKQAAVADAQAQFEYRNQYLQREEKLFAQSFTSADRLDNARAAQKSAAARLASAKAEAFSAVAATNAVAKRVAAANRGIVEAQARWRSAKSQANEASEAIAKAKDELRARQSETRAAKNGAAGAGVMADYRELRALNNSMVADRLVGPGSIVASGEKLLMLHVADPIRIQANVPLDLAAQIHVGSLTTVLLGSTKRQAAVTSIFPQADSATRTFTVEVLLRNPDHSILPGSFASMQIQTGDAERRLAVRNSAIHTDSSGTKFVWIATAKGGSGTITDWTCPMHTQVSLHGPGKCPICSMPLVPRSRGGTTVASRRVVTIANADGQYTAITGGLQKGDQVIWAGFDNLVEGTAIQVTPWGVDGPVGAVQPNAPGGSQPMDGLDMPADQTSKAPDAGSTSAVEPASKK